MKLREVKDQMSHRDPAEDEFQQAEKLDTRRPRLTLEHLNKLRKMREIRKLEMQDRREFYKKIYQRPVAI